MDIKKLFKTKKTNTETVKKKPKYRTNWTSVFAGFVSCAIVCALICCIIGVIILFGMLKDKPDLVLDDFTTDNSTTVYDRNGEVIAELGASIRENITFDDLPHSVVDAFVAVEDSRFFEHNGFDIPRFTKAMLVNLSTLSFSQGGSTFTMQLCKNTYFVNDAQGTNAAKTINRKIQEIALAFELETKMTKQEIFENYLNRLNFGGSRNIRGIEKASLYYFGKSVKELDLSESAYIAGVVNLPNAYNAYNHPEAATKRRNEVLYQMYNHGYITETEYKLALEVDLSAQLANDSSSYKSGSGAKYNAYIDVVVNEVYEATGLDPYTTTMNIYTSMDKNVQETMDNIQKGEVDGYFDFPNDRFELASIAIDNSNGEIVGVLGGRNYASGGVLLLNHATEQYKQPGSSIKPIMDYVLAFEYLGWATDHVITDKPINYVGTDIVIGNSDGVYRGEVNLKTCIISSLNTTALQTLQQVVNKIGSEKVVEYLVNMGFEQADDADTEFNVQWGIGGGEFYVSCEQMASAFGTILNGGTSYTPHTVRKITFESNKDDYEPQYLGSEVLSPQSCYLMNTLTLANTQEGPYLRTLADENYYVCSKTGTTDWGDSGRAYDIPDGSIKDGWCVAGTSDYSVATWIGYEKAVKGQVNYFTLADWNQKIKEKVTDMIIDATVESFGTPAAELERPEGISTITHIVSTFPYASPIDGMNSEYITTGEIITKYANLVAPEAATVASISNDCKVEIDTTHNSMTLTWPKYPDEQAVKIADKVMDLTLTNADGEVLKEATGNRLFDYSWLYGSIKYKASIQVTDVNGTTMSTTTVSSGDYSMSTSDIKIYPGGTVSVGFYYGYDVGSNSNVVTVKKEIADSAITISIPSTTDLESETAIRNWAKKYGISNLTIETAKEKKNDFAIEVKTGNKTSSYKTDFTILQSELSNVYVTYYQYKKAPKVTLSPSTGVESVDNKVISTTNNTITISLITEDISSPGKTAWTVKLYNSSGGQLTLSDYVTEVSSGDTEYRFSFKDTCPKDAYIDITASVPDGSNKVGSNVVEVTYKKES